MRAMMGAGGRGTEAPVLLGSFMEIRVQVKTQINKVMQPSRDKLSRLEIACSRRQTPLDGCG